MNLVTGDNHGGWHFGGKDYKFGDLLLMDINSELSKLHLQVSELKEWIWDQGHMRAAAHRFEDCARCKLEEKEGKDAKAERI